MGPFSSFIGWSTGASKAARRCSCNLVRPCWLRFDHLGQFGSRSQCPLGGPQRSRLGPSGKLVALVRGVAERGREEYDRLRQEIRASPVVYWDWVGPTGWGICRGLPLNLKTPWRSPREPGGCRSVGTPQVRYFLYRPSRGRTVVEEVLGDEFEGVLVSDVVAATSSGTELRGLRPRLPGPVRQPHPSGSGPGVR